MQRLRPLYLLKQMKVGWQRTGNLIFGGSRAFLGFLLMLLSGCAAGSPETTPPNQSAPENLEANLGRQVVLSAYQIPGSIVPAGGILPITIWWRPLAHFAVDDTISLVLTGPPWQEHLAGGQEVDGAQSGDPADHTSTWQPGQTVRRTYLVPVAAATPPGAYQLRVGMFTPTDRRWLPEVNATGYTNPLNIPNTVALQLIRIVRPLTPPAIADLHIQYPRAANFSGQLDFLGFSTPTPTIALGDAFTLVLFWRARVAPALSYTVFVHLLDHTAHVQSQLDNAPGDGRYPTNHWQKGEIVRDTYTLPAGFPITPGRYLVEIGLYDPQTLQRLPLLTEAGKPVADHLILGSLQVHS